MTARLQFPCNCSGHQRARSSQYRAWGTGCPSYSRARRGDLSCQKANPTMSMRLMNTVVNSPRGVIFMTLDEPSLNGECVQVSDEKVSIMETHSGRHDVTLYSRNVHDSLDESTGPDGIEFSIRFDREQPSIRLDHAVPVPSGSKSPGLGLATGLCFWNLERVATDGPS